MRTLSVLSGLLLFEAKSPVTSAGACDETDFAGPSTEASDARTGEASGGRLAKGESAAQEADKKINGKQSRAAALRGAFIRKIILVFYCKIEN